MGGRIPFQVSAICILMTLAQNGLDAQEPARPGAPFSMSFRWADVEASVMPSGFNLGNYEKCRAAPDP